MQKREEEIQQGRRECELCTEVIHTIQSVRLKTGNHHKLRYVSVLNVCCLRQMKKTNVTATREV